MKIQKLFWIVLLALVSAAIFGQTNSIITVDYGVPQGVCNQIASGMLHGISATYPAEYLIDGVKINAIRGADYHKYLPDCFEAATYNRIKATGAKLMIGLYYLQRDQ